MADPSSIGLIRRDRFGRHDGADNLLYIVPLVGDLLGFSISKPRGLSRGRSISAGQSRPSQIEIVTTTSDAASIQLQIPDL